MNADELNRLADRVEAASGPDRELDIAIALALPKYTYSGKIGRFFNAGPYYEGGPDRIAFEAEDGDQFIPGNGDMLVRDYTVSLDAAMTLAEPFMLVALSDIAADGLTGCCLCSDTSTNPPREHWGIPSERPADRQSILARAVCAAALRAIASQEKRR